MNTLYNSLLGQSAHASQQGQQSWNNWNNNYAQQQAMQYSQAQMLAVQPGLSQRQHRYQIDGVSMDLKQFVETLCPDPDDPWRSHLLLKYAGRDQ